ncbi:bifunctional 3-(3-hydroxy-phenyl)propionate/3-hydroxycinnamic acid hydroxylase [soil metagenome]
MSTSNGKAGVSCDFDVAIVGYGPVGQCMAAMLGMAGYEVAVFERWPALYPLPRACVIDHEVMRILQGVGVADEFSDYVVPTDGEYVWLNAKGETLYHFKYPKDGISGWPARNLMYQPDLEAVLDRRVKTLRNVELNMGWQADEYIDHGTHAELSLTAGEKNAAGQWVDSNRTRRITARYVIGADGANSFVREASGLSMTDLGFRADWLVVDFRPSDPSKHLDMPQAGQICDPARPITLMRHMGRKHVRWEMMLLPGETAADITQPAKVWSMIDRWVGPEDGVIDRAAVYTFKSAVADAWVSGRAVLAGDAAHLMPPFLGQGLCSGMRDVASLYWRLDLLLRGRAEPKLLQGYEVERKQHVSAVIERAVALGKVVCITDVDEAARRDAAILASKAPPIPEFPKLEVGLLHRDEKGQLGAAAGLLGMQAAVNIDGRLSRLDSVMGNGWCVLSLDQAFLDVLRPDQKQYLDQIGAHFFVVAGHPEYIDYLATLQASAVVVRPDFYLFGMAGSGAPLPDVIDDLMDQMPIRLNSEALKETA